MKSKLFILTTIALCAFIFGAKYGHYKEVKHREKIKKPVMTAHSSILKTGQTISEDIVDLGFKLAMSLTKGD